MRFFTRQLVRGELSDDNYDKAFHEYELHIARISELLPEALRRLLTSVSLHDGKFVSGSYAPGRGTLHFVFRCGNLQSGYMDAKITYLEVERIVSDVELVDFVRNREVELLYDEVDVVKGAFTHSMLFDPTGEVAVTFRQFELDLTPVDTREIPMSPQFIRHD